VSVSLRQRLGALVHDVPRALLGLRAGGPDRARAPWLRVRNRRERLLPGPDGRGVACDWRFTSDLHVAHVFPVLGRALMRRALHDWPIRFAEAPADDGSDAPEVSFVVGHRGLERLPLVLGVLRTLAAQERARVECVLVEQAPAPEARDALPRWVRHVHTPPPAGETRYSRAWAFNVGARAARGALLVFHDGDILVPAGYAHALLDAHANGAEVIDLKRFLFELRAEQNDAALAGRLEALPGPLLRVLQNAQGGTLAVAREAFFELGGFDESFIGWGGEDNEFWERARLRRVHAWGHLPFVHLWHAAQPEKGVPGGAPAVRHWETLSALPPDERVRRLLARGFGMTDGPRGAP
jgi:hypothetical protein